MHYFNFIELLYKRKKSVRNIILMLKDRNLFFYLSKILETIFNPYFHVTDTYSSDFCDYAFK